MVQRPSSVVRPPGTREPVPVDVVPAGQHANPQVVPSVLRAIRILNALAADQSLETNAYATGQLNTSANNTSTITVPAGAQQLRVMLAMKSKNHGKCRNRCQR